MEWKVIYKFAVNSLILIVLKGGAAFSQQDNNYLLENFVSFINNPAYTGNSDLNDLLVLTRQQWTGFKGAPATYLLATHFSLRDKNASAGAEVENNSIGPVKESRMFLNYSYRVALGEETFLFLGLKGGVGLLNISLSDIAVIDQGDRLFETDVNNILQPNFGSGLHLVYKKYYFDFSVPAILRNRLSPKGTLEGKNDNREDRRVITGGGAKFGFASGIIVHPAVSVWLVKGAPPIIDTRISADYNNFGGTVIFRPGSSAGGFLYYVISDDIKISYAYEIPTSITGGALTGSHEVFLGYNFSFIKQKTLSPRRF